MPVKNAVSTMTPRTTPGTPSRTIAQSQRRARGARRGLPAVVDLPLVAERGRLERRRPDRLDQVLPLGEELVVAPTAPRRPAGARRDRAASVHAGVIASPLLNSCPNGVGVRSPRRPRSQVCATTPCSVAAVRTGVTGLRCAQLARVDGERLVRGEHAQVGVRARRRWRPCGPVPPASAGFVGHPAHDRPRRDAAARGPRSRRPTARAAATATPPQACAEVAGVEPLQVRGARRVVADTTQVDHAVGQALPQGVSVGVLADRRAALELRGAVGDVLGGRSTGSAGRSRR